MQCICGFTVHYFPTFYGTLRQQRVMEYSVLITVVALPSQTCSRVLLPPQEKKQFLDQLSRPGVSGLARKGIKKKIVEKCKKISHCPYCEALNGKTVYNE